MSLLSPWFLLGLAGLALPWMLHRFSRNPPQVRDFPSSSFLEPTEPPISRRRQLRYRALFSLRVLALLLLCLLFAEPWWRTDGPMAAADRFDLIVLDQSLSMRAGNRWADALAMAQERVAGLPGNARIQVIGAGAGWQGEQGLERDATSALAQLRALRPGYGRLDYGDLVQRLDARAATEDAPVFVTLITDAQATSLPAQSLRLAGSNIAGLELVSVAGEALFNQAVQARAVTDDDQSLRLEIDIDGYGKADGPARELQVLLDGQRLAQRSVPAESGRQSLSIPSLSLPSGAQGPVTVELQAGDALAADDRVSVAVDDTSVPVVAVFGLGAPVSASARAFVATALETDDTARVLDVPATAAQELRLEAPNAIVFVSRMQWYEPPGSLVDYVREGGNVLLVPTGPQSQPGWAGASRGVGRIDRSHPLDAGRVDWSTVRWYAVPDTTPVLDDARVLVQTSAGDPVLLDRSLGEGHWLALNDTLDARDSDLPLQPAMVELMGAVVRWFSSDRLFPERLVSGERLRLPARHQLLDPEGVSLLSMTQTAGPSEQRLDEPGVYTVVDTDDTRLVTVATDPAESELRTIAQAELQAWQARFDSDKPADTATVSAAEGQDDVSSGATLSEQPERSVPAADDPARWAWWSLMLPLLLLLWAAESLWANGHLAIRRAG